MEKGVKKIMYLKGIVYPKMSVPNVRLTVKPNQEVHFKIAEWFAGTSAADKAKKISWIKQSNNRQTVISKELLSSTEVHKFKLTKKLCGYYYYIEASLSGNRDFKNKTGLYVKGWCEPKIVSSKWCTKNDGTDERSREYSFGENVYLGLDTEGVNGSFVTVELYRLNSEITLEKITQWITNKKYDPTKDDILAKIYEEKAEVIDGEINVDFTIQPSWKKGDKGNKFYVKIKNGKNYILDYNGDYIHARYLKVKNETVPIKKKTTDLNNNAPVKIGEPDKNRKNSHLCKFEQINVQDNGETFLVYNEGRTLLKKVTSETQSVNYRVYFDYDKSIIRSDAKETLKYLLDFLLFNQHLDMMLSGHADDRGTLDYNQALSERRAQAVRDFFTNGGLDRNRIKTRGFGEVNPLVAGKTEEAYKKNRRVEIDFRYLEYNQDAIIYETVSPNEKKIKDIIINVLNRSDEACFRKEKHNKNIIYINETEGKQLKPIQGTKVKQTVFSQKSDFPSNYALLLASYLNPFFKIYNTFAFHINSCAYYANKSKATLEVRTYPDVVWIGHFQYNYKDAGTYFFHQKNFDDLTTGITEVINELKNTIFYKIWRILPSNFIFEQTLLRYIEDQSKDYTYGIHTIHNRMVEKTEQELSLVGTQTNLITQTKYTRYFAAGVIYGFVVVGILIDLLMIYLTRGRNVVTKLQKFAKIARSAETILKKMNDAGVEFIPPSIAINAGMYYKKQKDGRLAQIYEANLNANPLVAVNFKKEFDLLGLITKTITDIKNAKHPKDKKVQEKLQKNKENNRKIAEFFKSKGVPEIKGSIEVRGDLIFEKKIQYNFLTYTYSFIDKVGNLLQTAHNEVIIKEQISFVAVVSGEYRALFKFAKLQTAIEAKVEFTAKGAAGVKLKYGVDNKGGKGLFVAQSLYCSGVEGTYYGSFEVSGILGVLKKETNNGKPTPFTLIEPFELPLFEMQLFKS